MELDLATGLIGFATAALGFGAVVIPFFKKTCWATKRGR
jgi:hypothetical protein